MAEYHVGAGAFAIYAGTLNKSKTMWQNKTDCTDEAISAVRDYMVNELLGGFQCEKAKQSGYEWTLEDGRIVKLLVEITEPKQEGIEQMSFKCEGNCEKCNFHKEGKCSFGLENVFPI